VGYCSCVDGRSALLLANRFSKWNPFFFLFRSPHCWTECRQTDPIHSKNGGVFLTACTLSARWKWTPQWQQSAKLVKYSRSKFTPKYNLSDIFTSSHLLAIPQPPAHNPCTDRATQLRTWSCRDTPVSVKKWTSTKQLHWPKHLVQGCINPARLNLLRRHLIFVDPQCGTCFMSLFWGLEFWRGSYILVQFLYPPNSVPFCQQLCCHCLLLARTTTAHTTDTCFLNAS